MPGLRTNDTMIYDPTDPTKRCVFNVSGIATGTERQLTIQNASGTVAYLADIGAASTPSIARTFLLMGA